ncbi:transmembrane protease serine 6 [Procambarus clarkii]|uniref:transmembrane protease serine 6 n=1 Tax=Procambarus clarkii TaxID=6728 RepID=UPI001E6776DB|nr:transmembrane protease serine 6-like [Procambarus clarkii]
MSSSHLLLLVLLCLLVSHLSLASPRRRGRARAQEEEEDQLPSEEQEEDQLSKEEAEAEWGLLPEEVDAFRDVLINLMDVFDDGHGTSSKKKKCRGRRCGSEDEDEEASMVVIMVEESDADPMDVTLASLLYDEDAPWGRCARSCITRRSRDCKYRTLCGTKPLLEEAFCYVPGSSCEDKVHEQLASEGYIITEEEEENVADDTEGDPHDLSDDSTREGKNVRSSYADVSDSDYDYGWFDYQTGNTGDDSSNTVEGTHKDEDEGPQYEEDEGPQYEEEEEEEHQLQEEHKRCGRKSFKTRDDLQRIIGGRQARKGEWPWQVAILNRLKEAICGGTIIAPQWVLTAAHCIEKRLYVRMAEHDLTTHDQHEMEMRVEQAFEHPDYDPETLEHDLALLKLPWEVMYSKRITSACLPGRGVQPPRKIKCVIAGWGKEREAHIFGSDVLNYARVPIVATSSCRRAYPEHPITNNHICAGYRRGSTDACAGDSGGPLVCEDKQGVWTVHGVTSFGMGCGDSGRYGVYTKVVNYVPWINRIITRN